MLLLLAMLRAQGIPARARSGFGAYFNPPYFEDHWVCEYWRPSERRWALADPQFDETWRARLGVDHDILDVPRDRFLTAGEAWAGCRTGEADSSRFGIDFVKLRGLWFIAGSLIRDLASLNKVEMLPWDIWGAQPAPNQVLHPHELEFFDELAALLEAPESVDAIRSRYQSDERVRVPDHVFNSLRQRTEAV